MMEVDLNAAQTVFALFYAITWGALANVWPRWRAFDWALIEPEGCRAFRRCILSLVLLNVSPIAFFIVVFLSFNDWKLEGSPWSIGCKLFVIMLQPFVLVGFYWLWVSIVQRFKELFYPDNLGQRYAGIKEYDLDPGSAGLNFLFGLIYVIGPPVTLVFTWCLCH
jgi:hypothetical protein